MLTSFFSNWRKNRKQPVEVNKKKTIEYHQGDVGEPFEELSTKLGLAEGSVDVIISVYCIHWVPDTRQAIKNISRFLRPGGKFYLLISTWSEFFVSEQEILNNIKWRDMLLSGLAIVQKGERPLLHESDVAASECWPRLFAYTNRLIGFISQASIDSQTDQKKPVLAVGTPGPM